ncbi:hypothetical protein D9619_001947 [Psilocybe cf. subviscida]|uniref:Uncharacterized protein n=1 Tax=Psilocybe cf. subviscida TaxID=2480587 RepID=A0A8H5F255_9AGAR|nr:hypothetical protein D9619_001947 [Psilocybe cf. subviscida]
MMDTADMPGTHPTRARCKHRAHNGSPIHTHAPHHSRDKGIGARSFANAAVGHCNMQVNTMQSVLADAPIPSFVNIHFRPGAHVSDFLEVLTDPANSGPDVQTRKSSALTTLRSQEAPPHSVP